MIEIPQVRKAALSRDGSLNNYNNILPAYSRETVYRVNLKKTVSAAGGSSGFADNPYPEERVPRPSQPPASFDTSAPQHRNTQPAQNTSGYMSVPNLENKMGRGQKAALSLSPGKQRLRVCFGWNTKDARCDVDASAFVLNSTGRVQGDDWFVFYSNPQSPDGSVCIVNDSSRDRQVIEVNLDKINSTVQKIAFVLTINEAFENRLHFGMLSDVYVRILEYGSDRELVSFRPEELFESITSMTIAEIYLHNGQWKFNPVGNGVNKDLAGQCAVYGVEIG